jgi:hypothetical protein
MKVIQVIDGADNATFSLFQATDEEFALLFPGDGQDMALIEDVQDSAVSADALAALDRIWRRPILKRDAHGLHGTLFYDNARRRPHIPASRREADTPPDGLNEAQRKLFEAQR